MKNINIKGITLIDLIVTIIIIAILGTVSYISLSGYYKMAKNSVRDSDLENIEKAIELYHLDKGVLPEPSNGHGIYFSGSLVWTQGIFGDSIIKDSKYLSFAPTDPATENPYSYSVTQDKREYQLGAAKEKSKLFGGNNIIKKSHATVDDLTAYLKGSYNGLFVKTSTGSTSYVVISPSIISSDLISNNYDTIIDDKLLSFNKYSNLPESYTGVELKIPFDFTPNSRLVFKGKLEELNYQDEQVIFLKNVSDGYKNTIVSGSDKYKNITNLEINTQEPSQRVLSVACSLVNNSLKYKAKCNGLNFINNYIINVLNIDITNIQGHINTVYEDSDGALWFGTNQGVTVYDGENWTTYQKDPQDSNSLVNDHVTSITKDNSGFYWFGTVNGLSKFDGDETWVNYGSEVLVATHIQYIYTSSDGSIWIGTNGGANSFNGADWESYEKAKKKNGGILSANSVNAILKDSNNNIWFGVQSNGVDMYDKANDTVENYSNTNGLVNKQVNHIFEDSNNSIWFGTDGGISKLSGEPSDIGNWTSYTVDDGITDNTISYIYEDTNNKMWVGTQNGLNSFSGSTWTNYTQTGGLSGNEIHLVYEDDSSNILVITEGGLTTIDSNGDIIE